MVAHPRIRRVAKWAGLIASIAIAGAFAASPWIELSWGRYGEFNHAMLESGAICSDLNWSVRGSPMARNWHYGRRWRAHSPYWLIQRVAVENYVGEFEILVLPLWIPLVLVAIPTSLLWYRDRRRRIPPGHCSHCGYNLKGNVSGRCSECGRPIVASPTS